MGELLPVATATIKGLMSPSQYFIRELVHIENCDKFQSFGIGIVDSKTLNSPLGSSSGLITYIGDGKNDGIQVIDAGHILLIRLQWNGYWHGGWRAIAFTEVNP